MPFEQEISRRKFIAGAGALAATAALPADAAHMGNERQGSSGLVPAKDFLLARGLSYLQTGSIGPTPRPVMDRTIAAWKELETNPLTYAYKIDIEPMEKVREKAAAFLGCKKDEIVLTGCTTDGMNAIAQGLSLSAGDHVLTTDQEHEGGQLGWEYMARTRGIALQKLVIPHGENSAEAIIERFTKAITPKTRVLSFSHILSSTGLRMPVAELSKLARDRGCISVVDGAQAPGCIQVDLKALGCDIYATSGHKWLLGPKGTGMLYLNETLGKKVDLISLEAGRAVYSGSSGLGNVPGVIGLGAAIDYISAIGMAKIEAHNLGLRNRLYNLVKELPMLQIVSPVAGPLATPLLTYRLPDKVDSRTLQQTMLAKHNVAVKVVPTQWLNGQRISTHLFNSDHDLAQLMKALRTELGAPDSSGKAG